MDSSSSSSLPFAAPRQTKYDVFLSFRGEDTRDTFTSHLRAALLRKKIETYIDYKLEKGDDIGPALLEAIEKSKIALVIFSKDYASSTWCLKELVHILGCKKRNKQIVIPIFYRIDPPHVRKQEGTYALAFAKLEERFKDSMDDPVLKWREALEEAANMSGFDDSSKTGTEADFVEEVAQDVLTKLNRESSSDLRGLFGIQRKIEKIESLLCLDSPGVCCVGIWGMGGIGKTTLADAVFHRLYSKFEAACFLANVSENSRKTDGLNDLRSTLVRELLRDKDVNINTPSIPPNILIRLSRTKALIVLDDVNDSSQLEFLVGRDHDQFCQGSRIIITAKDKGVLVQKVDNDKIYEVEGLHLDEALQLFHSHAFKNKSPTDYTELSREVVEYIKGIPLALKVLGSSFHRYKSKQQWEDEMNKLKRSPNPKIQGVLRVSYDVLEKNEEEIFLDIACFHKDRNMNDVKGMLDIRGFSSSSGIKVLIDMSLISISKRNSIEMHDLVQAMGRAIVRKQRIERSSRLFSAKDVNDVLTNNKEASRVQAIFFEELILNHADFRKMYKLRLLIAETYDFGFDILEIFSLDLPNSLRYIDWLGYPLKSLPSKFSTENLVVLHMPFSQVGAQLWNEGQSPVNLKEIDLGYSKHLTEVPNLSKSLKIERIDLVGCERLVEIPSYFQRLHKLTYLRLAGCQNLIYLPKMPCNVEFYDLSHRAMGSDTDVFISFRGEDNLGTFTSHLHRALRKKKIKTNTDYRLVREGKIAHAKIQRSTISVIIFSENYASSTWCLDELVHILECKEKNGQLVIPIFYDISPSDVQKQEGSYALAFPQLEKCFRDKIDKVHKWRDALRKAANLSGFHYSEKTETEADFVEEVVQDIWIKLIHEFSFDLRGWVGIKSRIQQIESLLCLDSPGVCCVGIWGMGGIGKTTLAEAVFHRNSSKFEACSLLKNVREKSEEKDGLIGLRNTLVRELLKDKDVNINTPSIPPHIQDRLRRTKALIVLDDVNTRQQLEVLVGDHDWFCQGSRIIITARDKGLLELKVDHEKIYNVEGLGSDEALELFHSHAFGNKSPATDYTELSREVVDYTKGIPLALKLMGSSFRCCKSKQEWEVQWKKVKRVPLGEIQKVLRVSYDGLDDNEKEIFLAIACFHKGDNMNDVKVLLDSCDFFGEAGINDLIDRSLISISKEGWSKEIIEMHDLVQEMGRAIAQEQRSRLFNNEDVYQVLTNNQRDGHVQAISLDLYKIEKLHLELEHANFKKMYQLRFLCVTHYSLEGIQGRRNIVSLDLPNSLRCLEWRHYPLKSLPSKFSTQNLVVLDMRDSKVEGQLWNEDQTPVNLKWIDLSECKHLTEVPNLSRSLNIEHIDLNGCQSLVEIPSYFQHLSKLTYLDLGQCTNLKNLPEMPCNLEFLNLSWTVIEELPSSVWSHEKISFLDITYCKHLKSLPSNSCKLKLSSDLTLQDCESLCEFWELPKNTTVLYLSGSTSIKELRNTSIESVVGLTAITLTNCKSLVSLPTNIWKLKYLKSLDLSDCSNFQHLPEISEAMEHLEFLNLSGTMVKEVPPSIGNLVALRKLHLFGCSIQEIPDDLFCLTSLQELDMSMTKIKSIPASIKQVVQLSRLFLLNCESLESLPELPSLLRCLEADGCTSLKTVSSSSTAITQGWEESIFSRGLHEKHIFSNCPKLDENARSNIMGDAQLRIMRMATASSKFKDKIEQPSYDSDNSDDSDNSYDDYDDYEESFVAISCPGNEIPNWFSHKSEGCSIKIELSRDWFSSDFLGFALSLVVAATTNYIEIGCKYNFKTSNGESHEVNHRLCNPLRNGGGRDSHEVFVWYNNNNVFEEVVGAQSATAFYKLVTEVSVDFTILTHYSLKPSPVEKCGICMLYGKDV